MCYGEDINPLYERAVRTHKVHNERWNYPLHVLRHDVTGGFWNKPAYLMGIIVQELSKAPSERAEWIMYVSHVADALFRGRKTARQREIVSVKKSFVQCTNAVGV